MSFGLPSVKHRPESATNSDVHQNLFEVPELMRDGITASQKNLEISHPLMESEQNYFGRRRGLNMVMLRNTQGLHAPLRISMEHKAVRQVGHMPFLPSSNIMMDVLTGRDIEIGPEDVFGTPEFRETMSKPHAMVEKSLGLL